MTEYGGCKPELQEIYPDVFEHGGLASMLKRVARRSGFSFDEINITAVARSYDIDIGVLIEASRGSASVYLVADKRSFQLGISTRGFPWASGSTDSIKHLAEAVCDWATGCSLSEFAVKYDFMKIGPLAEALESGDVIDEKWNHLLHSERYKKQWALLARVYEENIMRSFFPTISQGRVRLSADPFDEDSAQLLVTPLGEGQYRVSVVGFADTIRDIQSLDDAMIYLRKLAARIRLL